MKVLILVVMEDSLGRPENALYTFVKVVLILVVMEDSLGPSGKAHMHALMLSLNPCCNGR